MQRVTLISIRNIGGGAISRCLGHVSLCSSFLRILVHGHHFFPGALVVDIAVHINVHKSGPSNYQLFKIDIALWNSWIF
jgi:hypothetical protein